MVPPTPHPSPGRSRPTRRFPVWIALVAVAIGALTLGGCGSTTAANSPAGVSSTGRIEVVAAENFWASLARQLGGDRVEVAAIIVNPATDPHDYEPTAADSRTIAQARLVIANGAGYDPWVERIAAANRTSGQIRLDVGALLGLARGANPHRWYVPADVETVMARITADYVRIDPAHAATYRDLHHRLETVGLARYHELLAGIRARYAGTPVGASESIVEGITDATGLDLVTPRRYLRAMSEGADPTAGDTTTVHDEIASGRIRVWITNRQNATPDVAVLTTAARARGIPVTTVTETLVPADTTFQAWQTAQLQSLATALARATGR